jgi:RNA polymerase sigma-70 factor (ECF subfamily)
MDDALGGLSPKLASAVRLRVGRELEYAEVAEQLGISQAAARARVSRGLNQLAKAFEQEM